MSNPWGVKLKKTGLNEQRVAADISSRNELENKQGELADLAAANLEKKETYEDRQEFLAVDAMAGQQGILPGQNAGKKRRSKRRRNSKKRRTSKRRRNTKRRY